VVDMVSREAVPSRISVTSRDTETVLHMVRIDMWGWRKYFGLCSAWFTRDTSDTGFIPSLE